jgi:hypothetical protein
MEDLLSIDQQLINCNKKGLDFLLGQTLKGTYHLSTKVCDIPNLIFESDHHQIIFIREIKSWEKQIKIIS